MRESPDRPRASRTWMVWAVMTASAAAVVQMSGPSSGQVPPPPGPAGQRATSSFHPDASYTAETLLRNAANHVRDEQWPEAIDLYMKVIEQNGDSLALAPKGDPAGDQGARSNLYVDARRYCQERIARMPPAAREIYRRRVDARAEQLYREGAATQDRAPLRRVVDEMFCSSWGDEAADLLGDLAFRGGQGGEALASYRLLVPDAGAGDVEGLVHPDPSVDLARVAAKKLICRAALGEGEAAKAEVQAFRDRYPDAKGHVAGRDGSLADAVAEAIGEDALAPPAAIDGRWPTFAGSPSRSRVVPVDLDVGDFQWSVRVAEASDDRAPASPGIRINVGRLPGASDGDRELPYYPIVLGDQVVVSDGNKVTSFHLDVRPTDSGGEEARKQIRAWESPYGVSPSAKGSGGPPRHTLTAHGDRIYARLDSPLNGGPGGTIIAIRNNREIEGKLLWLSHAKDIKLPRRRNGAAEQFRPSFEGTPVADDRHVYVALTEAATETWVYVACLDAERGEPVWVKYLGNASSGFDQLQNQPLGPGVGQRLLSLEGQTVYYQTNMGAVAALDAETGDIRWLATYPNRDVQPGRLASEGKRDLNPAVVHDGLVIVAPQDAPELFAFDAATGRMAWKTQPMPQVAHLLGVAKGRLYATGDRVYTIDASTGRVARFWPDAGAGYEGYGRGLLAGDKVYWPTKTEIHVLDQATGGGEHEVIPLFQAFGHYGGNLAVGNGYLVVAERDELVVYCQSSRLIQRYQQMIVREPDRASHRYQLARLAETSGQDDLALKSFEEAAKLARASDLVDGRPLAEVARGRRHHLQMKLGAAARKAGDWAGAVRRFEGAASSSQTDRERLLARLELADAQARSGAPAEAVRNLQGLLEEERLNALSVAADERRTVRSDLLIADRLAALIRENGRGLYAAYDQAAEELLRRGRAERNPRLLREVGRSYPVAEVASEALLALGHLCEELGDPASAGSAYKRLLAIAPDDATRARALWGLAESYEAQGHLGPARDAFARAQARYPEVDLGPFGLGGMVGTLVEARLARPQFQGLGGGRSEPSLPTPLVRLGERRFRAEVRPIAAEGLAPSSQSPRIFAASGSSLEPIDPASPEPPWAADLAGEPVWVGYLGDRVLAATSSRLFALAPGDGRKIWEFDPADPRGERQKPNPFNRTAPGAEPARAPDEPAATGRLRGFRLVGPRIYLLRGDRELLAVDAETGQLDWSYAPAGGGINRHLLVTPSRVVLQASKSRSLVVLDAESGRLRGEFPRAEAEEPWGADPLPLDDDHVVVSADPKTVSLIDLSRGAAVWTYRDDSELPRFEPPLLFSDSGRLLALFGGNTLVRLDPATGKPLWESPLGAVDLSGRPGAFAFDGERIFCASLRREGRESGKSPFVPVLTAYDLADGSVEWRRHLVGPASGWELALTDRCVVAYPTPSRSDDGPLDELPLGLYRREDGRPVGRLTFEAPVRSLAVWFDPRATLVATEGRVWSLGAPAGPDRAP